MKNLQNKVVTRVVIYTDSSTSNTPSFIYAKQNDAKSRYIIATLRSSSGDIALSGVVQLNAKKPDGKYVYCAGTINPDNTVTFELKPQLLSVAGAVSCDVSMITYSNDEGQNPVLMTSSTFFIIVEKSIYNPDAIESTDEYSVVTETIFNGIQAMEKHKNAAQSAALEAEESANYVKNIESQITDDLNNVKTSVSNIANDYLKSADKAEIKGDIATVNDELAEIKENVDLFFKDIEVLESTKVILKELQEDIYSDETGFAGVLESINKIEDDFNSFVEISEEEIDALFA